MEFNYDVVLTDQFDLDFAEIADYFLNNFKNNDLVANLNKQIVSRKKLLTKYPRSFPIFESNSILFHEYRSFNAGNYKVFYYIDEILKTVFFKRILHGSMDLKNMSF